MGYREPLDNHPTVILLSGVCFACPVCMVMREKGGVPNSDQIKYLGAGFHLSDWSSVDLVKLLSLSVHIRKMGIKYLSRV